MLHRHRGPWFAPGHVPPPAAPSTKPREHIWSLRSSAREGAHRIDCELMGHGEYGWECLLLKEDEWFYWRRFHTRGEALIEAEETKARYLRDGGVLLS
jgi:hypothetical protein